MQIYRIAYERYAAAPLDGEGSYRVGGRWSSRGTRMAYTSTTATLAMLEFRAHVDATSFDPINPPKLVVVSAEINDASVLPLATPLPTDWRTYPAPAELTTLGDAWIADRSSLGLIVPSALLPTIVPERNVLINPQHPDFADVTWRADAFSFDPRLLT